MGGGLSQGLGLLCAWPRGAQLSGPRLMGPVQTPRWVKGVLWCPVPDLSEGCPCLLFSCQAWEHLGTVVVSSSVYL